MPNCDTKSVPEISVMRAYFADAMYKKLGWFNGGLEWKSFA
jgi:hypothetical protein